LKSFTKYITSKTLQPAIKKYLAKTRVYQYQNISLTIPPGVFHPGFFFSTKILLKHVLSLQLNKKKLLELGAGSGLISFAAAQKNAIVTATDINPLVIEFLKLNSKTNNISIRIILSDLFDDIEKQQFDIIVINPPYYKKNPEKDADFAWYCGENGEYFEKLFRQLKNYIHDETKIFMVLCDGCDIDMIKSIAGKNGFVMRIIFTKQNIIENNFIFNIESIKLL
jgi:release factor glutamine methyltransferase